MASSRGRFACLVAFWSVTALTLLSNGRIIVDGFSAASSPLFRHQKVERNAFFRVSPDTTLKLTSPQLHAKIWKSDDGQKRSLFLKIPLGRMSVSLGNRMAWLKKKFRRSMAILFTVSLFWFSSARLHTLPTHASSSPEATQTVRLASTGMTASLDQMVDRYVKDHMFDEDQFDPVESAFRETHDDVVTGEYPSALQQTTADALGKEVAKQIGAKQPVGSAVLGLLKKPVVLLQTWLGLSEIVSWAIVWVGTIVAFVLSFINLAISYSTMQKRSIDKITKKRYGDTYSVSAKEKVEEDVEAPDDDEDEDDDEEEDEDDEDE